jgi:ABC-2 type transport system ATP-binding protein
VSDVIAVSALKKVYRVPERDPGVRAAALSLLRPRMREIEAVSGVSFSIAEGEIVGFLGPNGAGKTTTLKMLSGVLHPTRGTVDVLGHVPWRRERTYLRQIAMIMGNRNQLQWDLPASDSFELNRAIYKIPASRFLESRDELVALLDIGDLLRKPVRNLSLGERMKVEFAASLLHQPRVLFLDEPSIGLDVAMQKRVRQFIAEYNRRLGATVVLTSHYMADVEALCKRIILIHHGRLLFDGALSALQERFASTKTIRVVFDVGSGPVDLTSFGEVLAHDESGMRVRVPKAVVADVAAHLLSTHRVLDITIEDEPIEDVIDLAFTESRP